MKNKIIAGAMAAIMTVSSLPILALATATVQDSPNASNLLQTNENKLRMWYTKPSSQYGETYWVYEWEKCTLPIGNGDMGANVYGEIASEHLTFNEKTLWTGGPSDSRPDYIGGNLESKGKNGETLREIQRLLLEGKNAEAHNLCNQLTGEGLIDKQKPAGYGAYQCWGDIYFDYKDIDSANAKNYVRELDLTTAISKVDFDINETHYSREFFISHPDNVLVAKLTAENGKKLNLDIRFPSKQGGKTVAQGNTLTLKGQVKDNQMQYDSQIKVVNTGGTITANGDKLKVEAADSVLVYLAAATDYKNDYPKYRTGETADALHQRVADTVDKAVEKGYQAIRDDHIADYQSIFNRVDLDLGQQAVQRPTDELLSAYNNGDASTTEARALEVMLFQFGRYLLISSSREDSQLPANLQGVWNCRNEPSWNSDYHMNVNLQMNYWPAYSTNMAECALPLVNYVDSLREPGRVTAKIYMGIESTAENPENGFTAHTQNTPFGWTCPGWEFYWGWSPAAVPWILQNVWDYYDYTRDENFLKNTIYPIMKEEAKLYDQFLVRGKDGKLYSAPAYSPETGPRTLGNTYEHTLVWQLYEDTIKAAKIVGETDTAMIERWKKNQADLRGPIEIGEDGQIKEWFNETKYNTDENGNKMGEGFTHRHLSHMLGVFPGDLISVETPQYLEAAIKSMNLRTDTSTGWGMGQRINTWARLGDGNRAHKLITDLFKNGIYKNLWDAHPPFQIDGNFGYTSGVAEMLLQSNMGYINILPALPDKWADGSYDGLVAQGNFEVAVDWTNKKATNIELLSNNGGDAVVQATDISLATVRDLDGNPVNSTILSKNRISFPTEAGKTYTIDYTAPKDWKALQTLIDDGTNNIIPNINNHKYVEDETIQAYLNAYNAGKIILEEHVASQK